MTPNLPERDSWQAGELAVVLRLYGFAFSLRFSDDGGCLSCIFFKTGPTSMLLSFPPTVGHWSVFFCFGATRNSNHWTFWKNNFTSPVTYAANFHLVIEWGKSKISLHPVDGRWNLPSMAFDKFSLIQNLLFLYFLGNTFEWFTNKKVENGFYFQGIGIFSVRIGTTKVVFGKWCQSLIALYLDG